MKRIVLILSVFFWTQAQASLSELFRYDSQRVEKALINAEALDHYVNLHKGVDLSGLTLSPVLKNFESESVNLFNKGPETLLGIPPFWWGFFLSIPGILIVYFLTDQNSEYAKEALIGCVVSGLLYAGLGFLWGGCWFWYWY